LLITKAAITPGTQPIKVSIKTIITEPQPLSITAKGGKIIQRMTRPMDILYNFGMYKLIAQSYKFKFRFPIEFVKNICIIIQLL